MDVATVVDFAAPGEDPLEDGAGLFLGTVTVFQVPSAYTFFGKAAPVPAGRAVAGARIGATTRENERLVVPPPGGFALAAAPETTVAGGAKTSS